jgi:hypothetical protein
VRTGFVWNIKTGVSGDRSRAHRHEPSSSGTRQRISIASEWLSSSLKRNSDRYSQTETQIMCYPSDLKHNLCVVSVTFDH